MTALDMEAVATASTVAWSWDQEGSSVGWNPEPAGGSTVPGVDVVVTGHVALSHSSQRIRLSLRLSSR